MSEDEIYGNTQGKRRVCDSSDEVLPTKKAKVEEMTKDVYTFYLKGIAKILKNHSNGLNDFIEKVNTKELDIISYNLLWTPEKKGIYGCFEKFLKNPRDSAPIERIETITNNENDKKWAGKTLNLILMVLRWRGEELRLQKLGANLDKTLLFIISEYVDNYSEHITELETKSEEIQNYLFESNQLANHCENTRHQNLSVRKCTNHFIGLEATIKINASYGV